MLAPAPFFAMLCKIIGTIIIVKKKIGAILRSFLFIVKYKEKLIFMILRKCE